MEESNLYFEKLKKLASADVSSYYWTSSKKLIFGSNFKLDALYIFFHCFDYRNQMVESISSFD